VREAFTFCGKIKTVRLAVWQHTQQQKGFCYVQFEKENAAEIAVKKQGAIQVGGRKVFVDYETGAPKASYRAPDGRQWSKAQKKGRRS
jgi:nucleolin